MTESAVTSVRRSRLRWAGVGVVFIAVLLVPILHITVWQDHSQALDLERSGRTVTVTDPSDVRLTMGATKGRAYVEAVSIRLDGTWRELDDASDTDDAYRFYDDGDVIPPPPNTKYAVPLTVRVGSPTAGVMRQQAYEAALRDAPGWGFWVADGVAFALAGWVTVLLIRRGNRRMDAAAAALTARGREEKQQIPATERSAKAPTKSGPNP